MKTRYTWKYVIKTIVTQINHDGAFSDIRRGLVMFFCSMVMVLVRILLIVLLPLSAPIIVYVMRRVERDYERHEESRRKARDADV